MLYNFKLLGMTSQCYLLIGLLYFERGIELASVMEGHPVRDLKQMNFTLTDLICSFTLLLKPATFQLVTVFRPVRDLRDDDIQSCHIKSEETQSAKGFFLGSDYWSPMKQVQSIWPNMSRINTAVHYVLYSKHTQVHFSLVQL